MEDGKCKGSPGRSYLDSVTARFEQQYQERKNRTEKKKTQREMELVHSQYLKQNIVNPQEMAHASFVVGTWSHKHGDIEKKWHKKDLQNKKKLEARFSPYSKSNANLQSPKSTLQRHRMRNGTLQSSSSSVYANEGCQVTDAESNSNHTRDISTNSSFTASNHVVEDVLSQIQYSCHILGCEMKFSMERTQENHIDQFDHCPINPCLHMTDGVVEENMSHTRHICRSCGEMFKDYLKCIQHQDIEKHSSSYYSFNVAGYVCPKTLDVFSTYEECSVKIQQNTSDMKFPFQDDLLTDNLVKPCPVSAAFIEDYMVKCKSCPFTVKCVDCELEFHDSDEIKTHQTVTNDMHVITSYTEASKADVFSGYLEEYAAKFNEQVYSQADDGPSEKILSTFCNFILAVCEDLDDTVILLNERTAQRNRQISSVFIDDSDDDF